VLDTLSTIRVLPSSFHYLLVWRHRDRNYELSVLAISRQFNWWSLLFLSSTVLHVQTRVLFACFCSPLFLVIDYHGKSLFQSWCPFRFLNRSQVMRVNGVSSILSLFWYRESSVTWCPSSPLTTLYILSGSSLDDERRSQKMSRGEENEMS
jgi:hypothetical protein